MDIDIQTATLSMTPVLAGIHAACFGGACWNPEQICGSLDLATTEGWVADVEGVLAGFLLCQKTGEEMEILTFGVHPSYQRQGIGERLIRRMLKDLPQNGTVFLEVAADNSAARRLYEKCGFKETATRKGYYWRAKSSVDAVCYRYVAGNT